MKLYHCDGARSLRPLWLLEEMALEYELEAMEFPPRFLHKGYTQKNPVGTVPFFEDGDVTMTESVGICQYLVDTYGPTDLSVHSSESDYANYLNWLHRSDATLTFPQTIVLRYSKMEPLPELQKVPLDYTKWFLSRLRAVEAALETREFLCAGRFTIADICVAYAIFLADTGLGLKPKFKNNTLEYYQRMLERVAFQRALAVDVPESTWGGEINWDQKPSTK